jgi:carboxynorspermidine decarboxylase
MDINFDNVQTPCYVVDERLIIKNLEVLKKVIDSTHCRILLAQKAFSMFSLYPLIGKYLNGTAASSLYEAKLGHEEMGGEVHIFSPAYKEEEFDEILACCDHVIFNSFPQYKKFKNKISDSNTQCGIRINPEYSEIETDIYNPCFKHSRLGVTLENFDANDMPA